MGYDRHHAIVVASFDRTLLGEAHRTARALCPGRVSPIIDAHLNGTASFFVAPDGSKEGWAESDRCDGERDALVEWMDAQRYSDGSTALDWAEVQFGDDNGESLVIRHSDEHWRRTRGEVLAAMKERNG